MLRTPLCDLLGIDVPILNVGFGEAAPPELAAAVSNAGGLGVIGSGRTPDAPRELVARARALTNRPFGANVIIAAFDHPDATDQIRAEVRARIETLIEERVDVIVLFWGDPAPFVDAAHANGVKVLIQVGSTDEAVAAADAGVDAVIAQGVEAGGHVKATESIWDVLPRTVEAVAPTPVLASGGIGDGRAIARAISLGAEGVSLGTRFVASREAYVPTMYKERVVAAGAGDTFFGELFNVGWSGAPERTLKTKTFADWDAAGRPPIGARPGEGDVVGTQRGQPWHRYQVGMVTPEFEGDLEHVPLWAGESVSEIGDLKPAGEIVRDLVREAEAALYSATT